MAALTAALATSAVVAAVVVGVGAAPAVAPHSNDLPVAGASGQRPRPVAGGRPAAIRVGQADPARARAGRPVRIAIPSIGARAPVVPIATEGRVLVPPSDPTTVGWWRDGARTGATRGAAVVAGHTISTGGGAFDDLDRVRPGDFVKVTTSRGRLKYAVDRVVTVPKSSLAQRAQRLFGHQGRGRLVLVTCENWNGEVHLSNQVVIGRIVAR